MTELTDQDLTLVIYPSRADKTASVFNERRKEFVHFHFISWESTLIRIINFPVKELNILLMRNSQVVSSTEILIWQM